MDQKVIDMINDDKELQFFLDELLYAKEKKISCSAYLKINDGKLKKRQLSVTSLIGTYKKYSGIQDVFLFKNDQKYARMKEKIGGYMKKTIFILFLLFGIFTFSTTGFKNIKWGTTREEVIKIMGEPNYSKGQIMQYQKIKFDNVDLRFVTMKFDNGKLISWEGAGFVLRSDLNVLVEHFQKKYKGFKVSPTDENKFMYEDAKGSIYLSYNKDYIELSIKYESKEYKEKEHKKLYGGENDL